MNEAIFKLEELADKAEKIKCLSAIIKNSLDSTSGVATDILLPGFSLFSDIIDQFSKEMQELTKKAFEEEGNQKLIDEANAIIKKQFCKSAKEIVTAFNSAQKINSSAYTDTNE